MRCRSRTASEGGTIVASRICRRRSCIRTTTSEPRSDRFGVAETDTLAVAERGTGQVLGTLNEAYAARRYAQETNLAMKGVLGGG